MVLLILKKIETSIEIANIISRGNNRVILPSDSLMILNKIETIEQQQQQSNKK